MPKNIIDYVLKQTVVIKFVYIYFKPFGTNSYGHWIIPMNTTSWIT